MGDTIQSTTDGILIYEKAKQLSLHFLRKEIEQTGMQVFLFVCFFKDALKRITLSLHRVS